MKFLLPRIKRARAKLDSYIQKLSESLYYAAARILCLDQWTGWLKDILYNKIKKSVLALWETFCWKLLMISYDNKQTAKSDKTKSSDDIFFQIYNSLDEEIPRPTSLNEFESYMNEAPHKAPYETDPEKRISALQWWQDTTQQIQWPELSRFAIEVLSIKAMSDRPEVVFSGGRRTITWDKAQMTSATAEALECLKQWKRTGILCIDF